MEWMYEKEEVEQKEYLLGKKISSVPTQAGPNTNVPSAYDIPGALFKFDSERAQTRAENDMKAKMREDPLFQIREREEESRRKILKNPVKMREMQKLQEAKIARAKKKEKKKHKKKKSHSENDDSDNELLQQYLAALQKGKKKKRRKSSSSDEWEEKVADSHQKRSQKSYGLVTKGDSSVHTQQKPTNKEDEDHWDERNRDREKRRDRHKASDRDREKDREGDKRDSAYRREDKDLDRERRHDKRADKGHYHERQRDRHDSRRRRSRSRDRSRKTRSRSRSPKQKSTRLNREEKEKRLQEMMVNAAWREEDRKGNVKEYIKEEQKEQEKLEDKGGSFAESYLNPMMSQHASGSSLEDRLQRNKFNVQRTRSDMDKNSYQK